jgi:cell division protein ZapA
MTGRESTRARSTTGTAKAGSTKSVPDAHDFTIGGLPFRLRSSQDDETVKALVQFVDQKIQLAMKATKSGSLQSAAILAALNIAEELIVLKRRALREIDQIETRARQLAQDLDHTKTSKGASTTSVNN